jgi:hypothetical protein
MNVSPKPIDEKTWIEWRLKLGCRKHEAKALFKEHERLLRDSTTPVRRLTLRHGETWEQALKAFLDQMPRNPSRFLAMVAAIEVRHAIKAAVLARKAVGRQRYRKRYERHSASGRE